MMNWWTELSMELQLFYGIGIIALSVLLIQLLLTLIGLDDDIDISDEMDSDGHDSGLSLLSVRSVTAFFAGFGWAGVAAASYGLPFLLSMVIALVVGFGFMFMIYYMMLALLKMQASGTLNYGNAVGEVATCYVTIPPSRTGSGQIEVMIQGRSCTVEALTSGDLEIAPATKVKVVGLVGRSTLLVETI
ncbi:MAG: NfeD family protein [Verrucomicrobiota bacterium]